MSTYLRQYSVFFFILALIGVAAGCGGKRTKAHLGPQELFELGMEEYNKKHYFNAIEHFQAVVWNYPGETIVDTAQYYLALSYFGEKNYELARVEFDRLVNNYPSSAFFEQALFMKAVSTFELTPRHYGLDQSELTDAIRQFEDFIIDYPESELIPDVQRYLKIARTRLARKYYEAGIVYSRMGAYKSAEIYFQKVIDEYTDTEFAARAAYQNAEMEFKLKRFDSAAKKFGDFVKVFPDHEWVSKAKKRQVEAAFKSGEAAFKKGDYALAQQKFEAFQTTYPNNGWSKKVRKYLKKISELTDTTERTESHETES